MELHTRHPHFTSLPSQGTGLAAIRPRLSTSSIDPQSEPRQHHTSCRRFHHDSCKTPTALAANARLLTPRHPRPSRCSSASSRWTYHCGLAQAHRPRTHGIWKFSLLTCFRPRSWCVLNDEALRRLATLQGCGCYLLLFGSSHECMQGEQVLSAFKLCRISHLRESAMTRYLRRGCGGLDRRLHLRARGTRPPAIRGGRGKLRAREGHRGESAASFTWLHDRHGVNIFVSASYVGTGCRRAGPPPKAGPAQAAVDSATEAPESGWFLAYSSS